jgi:hypothetical protein
MARDHVRGERRLTDALLLRLKSGAIGFDAFRQRLAAKAFVEDVTRYWASPRRLHGNAATAMGPDDVQQIVEFELWRAVDAYVFRCPSPCTRVLDTEADFLSHRERRHAGHALVPIPTIGQWVHGRVGHAVHHELRRVSKRRSDRATPVITGSAIVAANWRLVDDLKGPGRGGVDGTCGRGRVEIGAYEPAPFEPLAAQRRTVERTVEAAEAMRRLHDALEAGLPDAQLEAFADLLGLTRTTLLQRRRLQEALACDWLRSERTA